MIYKKRAPRNRTITLSNEEVLSYQRNLLKLNQKVKVGDILNKTINQDLFQVIDFLPDKFVDLLFLDPPYNLDKSFNLVRFNKKSVEDYAAWIDKILRKIKKVLKPNASIYFCCDWHTSVSVFLVLSKYFTIRNRITWEREKGRGSLNNWKNNIEDIWYCTLSDEYVFNVNSVKIKKKVIAPYRDDEGNPKDWIDNGNGGVRLTFPSNIWTDISVPFWSMPENTDHPTQKPEKLLAKIILASTNPGNIVFDPFCGSGTTTTVAKKLDRKYLGIEIDKFYSCLTEKRLVMAEKNKSIQGYFDGVFWERNSLSQRNK